MQYHREGWSRLVKIWISVKFSKGLHIILDNMPENSEISRLFEAKCCDSKMVKVGKWTKV